MTIETFNLPDLGEGLPEAEIVNWHVKEGDTVKADEPMVSVETAKAVVEVPSPYSGTVVKIHAPDGTILPTHKPLVDIDTGEGGAAEESSKAAKSEPDAEQQPSDEEEGERADSGTVVGKMMASDEVVEDTAIVGRQRRGRSGRVKAAPAVRRVKLPEGTPEPLRGPRRAMAQSMSTARDLVSQCTIFDDADIHAWFPGQDITARLLRAIAAGCSAEPALNGFYDGENMTRQLEERVDVA